MEGILPELRWCDKERLLRELRCCGEARRKTRLLVIVNLVHGRSPTVIAATLQMHRSTVYRVAERFRSEGMSGLCDSRTHNGRRKVTPKYLSILHDVVEAATGLRLATSDLTHELLVVTLFRRRGSRFMWPR
jgi:transposase